MHRVIEDRLEQVLAGNESEPAAAHLASCEECTTEVAVMRQHREMLRSLRGPEMAPRAGFYARVMERIELQRPISIWQLFFESSFGRRLAMASMAVAVVFGFYLVSSERFAQPVEPQTAISSVGLPDKDTVLVNLVTYREQ